jgi:hypothetical protein
MNREFVFDHASEQPTAWTRAGTTLNRWLWGALCCGLPGMPCYFCTCCERLDDVQDRDRPRVNRKLFCWIEMILTKCQVKYELYDDDDKQNGFNPRRGPSAGWWVPTTANVAGTNCLTCLPKHGGARRRSLNAGPSSSSIKQCLSIAKNCLNNQ